MFGKVVELLVEQLWGEVTVESRVALAEDFVFSAGCFFRDGGERDVAVEFAAFLSVEAGAHVEGGGGGGFA